MNTIILIALAVSLIWNFINMLNTSSRFKFLDGWRLDTYKEISNLTENLKNYKLHSIKREDDFENRLNQLENILWAKENSPKFMVSETVRRSESFIDLIFGWMTNKKITDQEFKIIDRKVVNKAYVYDIYNTKTKETTTQLSEDKLKEIQSKPVGRPKKK